MAVLLSSLLVVLSFPVSLTTNFSIDYGAIVSGVYQYQQDDLGNYNYELNLPLEGRREKGTVVKTEAGKDSYKVVGWFEFTQEEDIYRTYYVADSNGYRAHTEITELVDDRTLGGPPRKQNDIQTSVLHALQGTRLG